MFYDMYHHSTFIIYKYFLMFVEIFILLAVD